MCKNLDFLNPKLHQKLLEELNMVPAFSIQLREHPYEDHRIPVTYNSCPFIFEPVAVSNCGDIVMSQRSRWRNGTR